MHRDRYIEALRLIADLDAQIRYEREVPIADVSAELVCMWFDDLDASSLDSGLSPSDAATLRNFTTFYDVRVHELPPSANVAALHANATWNEIVRKAKAALDALVGRGI